MAEIPHDIRFALDEFDRDQLPESQRGLRGEAFQEAVREYLTERFAPHGGAAHIAVGEDLVILRWKEDAAPAPLAAQAADQLREGHVEKGVGLLRVALRRDPNDPDALYNLGMALSDRGETDEAAALLTRLVERRPGYLGAPREPGIACGRAPAVRWPAAPNSTSTGSPPSASLPGTTRSCARKPSVTSRPPSGTWPP